MIPGVRCCRDGQGGFYSIQVHLYQLRRSYFYTRTVKCVIGKKSRQHNGFVTQSSVH